jgi:hypothetical protein
MAVTRGGIPIRTWCWPGYTADVTMIEQVRADLRDWKLTRMLWVTDRGFASEANRRILQLGGGHYIQAEKLRGHGANSAVAAALARAGRYRPVAGNLRVKQINPRPGDSVLTDRFILCHNPEQAVRDAAVREQLLAQLGGLINGSDRLSPTKRAELRGKISTQPGLNRYLRTTPGGLLRRRRRRGQGRGASGRQVAAALLGPAAVRRRHRPGLQAAHRGRISTLPEVPGEAERRRDAVVTGSGVIQHADDTGAEILDFVHDP